MRQVRSRTRRRSRQQLLYLAVPALMLVCCAVGCGKKSDATSDANTKRWAEYQKTNPPGTEGIRRSYELRQQQLAARRKKTTEGKSDATASDKKPASGEKPTSTDKSAPPAAGQHAP